MEKTVKDLVYGIISKEEETFNRNFENSKTCGGCIRLVNLISARLFSKTEDIYRDLRGASRLGLISEKETEEYISICRDLVTYTVREYKQCIADRFGEYEYFISDKMINNGNTREEADNWWNYLNSDLD